MAIRLRVRRAPGPPDRPPRRSGWSARALVIVVHGVIASFGAAYLVTRSIPVTLVSGALAVLLAGWLATIDR